MENKDKLLPFKGRQRGLWQVADTLDYELLKANAKENRKQMTEAESAFWSFAKGSGLGQKCRRQYIIGQYIVDFFFRESMLIVELDGGYHFPRLDPQAPLIDPQAPLKGDVPKMLTGDMLIDFANKEDKGWINNPDQIRRDKERQDWLERQGYTIIRFTNEEVLFDTEKVVSIVKSHLKASL